MKPLPSPSGTAIAGSISIPFGNNREQGYNAAFYSGHAQQTQTFSSVRSTASLPSQSQLMMHQFEAHSSGEQQHRLDNMQHAADVQVHEHRQELREQRRISSSAALSSAEAASLKLELQARDNTSPNPRVASFVLCGLTGRAATNCQCCPAAAASQVAAGPSSIA
jgi:hypothetical protein